MSTSTTKADEAGVNTPLEQPPNGTPAEVELRASPAAQAERVPTESAGPSLDQPTPNTEGLTSSPAPTPTQTIPTEAVSEAELLQKNEDYQLLTSALTVLKNQLAQGEADLKRLIELRERALEEPHEFVEKLLAKTNEPIPVLQQIVALPEIDFSKYQYQGRASRRAAAGKKNRASPSSTHGQTSTVNPKHDILLHFKEPYPTSRSRQVFKKLNYGVFDQGSPGSLEGGAEAETPPGSVDGSKDDEDNSTSGMPWTDDENRRLVDLMEVYPEEPVAMRRFEKLAAALGTRTARQVGSRVQKILSERKTAGSGRVNTPKTSSPFRSGSSGRVAGQFYNNKSTGLRYLSKMGMTMSLTDDGGDNASDSDKDIDPALKNTEEYKELVRLRKLAKATAAVPAAHTSDPVHHGFKCDRCDIEPIVGTRWKCKQCPDDAQVDLCSDCHGQPFENGVHTANHEFERVDVPELQSLGGNASEYAYLGF
ncbi:ZZ-type zinc finger-containing protein 3 [Borealophlyctis nickersoniae]|nr:ZZ-type zinc finger-containing protein 3 [Borealophlyctis nickersoniae]